jgi:glycosyltransferase involved in cell wall biosynthesis
MKRKVHFFSFHEQVEGGHGGNRRLAQVGRFLESAGFGVVYKCVTPRKALPDVMLSLVAGANPLARAPASRFRSPRGLFRVGALLRTSLDDVQSGDVCAFDSMVTLSSVLFERVRSRGAVVTVFPQNIDSLCPGGVDPISGARGPNWFMSELSALKTADLVCCISREEQWLLGLHGISSSFLPYYPTDDVVEYLNGVRASRHGVDKDLVLVLGTAHNVPTFEGMKELLHFWASDDAAADLGRVVVAGYGTEKMAALAGPTVTVAGGVTPQELEELMRRARACVVHQVPTTGCLTRIPELLLAGVPVVANNVGARTYHNVPGIYVYERMEEISGLIAVAERYLPPGLERPAAAEAALAKELAWIIGRATTGH